MMGLGAFARVLVVGACVVLLAGTALAEDGPGSRLHHLATWKAPSGAGTESLSVQTRTQRVALGNSIRRVIHVLDVTVPENPRFLGDIPVPGAPGDEVTSVAFHPTEDWIFAALSRADPRADGRLLVFQATGGKLLAEVPVGVDPDAVAVDPLGRTATVANEAEGYWMEGGRLRSHPGTVSVVDLRGGVGAFHVKTLSLQLPAAAPGFVRAADRRHLERPVDLDGNGAIEGKDEKEAKVVVDLTAPENLEPEYVAYRPDGQRAWITLQENNGLVEVDPLAGRVLRYVGLGMTRHPADVEEDGKVDFATALVALREPDALAFTPDGRWILTADEGDTEPKASKTPRNLPAGGGRTVTVLDAATGSVLGDTGNEIDAGAAAVRVYPDDRSDSKGSEPEGVLALQRNGRSYAVAGLERASALALIDLADPARPHVLQVVPLPAGSVAPEVLGSFETPDGRTLVLSANEVSGDLSVFELR